MRSLVCLLVLMTVLAEFAHAGTQIEGSIQNAGKPSAGAYILVHDCQDNYPGNVSSNHEIRADQDGRFRLGVGDGCYDIFVSQPLSDPYTRRVVVERDKTLKLNIKLKSAKIVRLRED